MFCGIIDFACWVAVVGLAVAFFGSLAVKWGWLEWLQIHAPNDFIHKLLMCKFCCSFWMAIIICLVLSIVTGDWWIMIAPLCSTVIARELW